jgi:hypothetical protein
MQTAVPRSKHGQYDEVGGKNSSTCIELHVGSLPTNVRKKTVFHKICRLRHKLLQNTHRTNAPLLTLALHQLAD